MISSGGKIVRKLRVSEPRAISRKSRFSLNTSPASHSSVKGRIGLGSPFRTDQDDLARPNLPEPEFVDGDRGFGRSSTRVLDEHRVARGIYAREQPSSPVLEQQYAGPTCFKRTGWRQVKRTPRANNPPPVAK